MRIPALLAAGLLFAGPASATERDSREGREAFSIYKSIVEMPTVKGRGQVPKMARALSAKLRAAGFAARDIEIVPVGETAGLIVTLRGTGARAPLLFLAHMDVVEAKAADWERDPFKLVEENGFLFGRGTSDNKLGVAQLTAAFIRLKREGYKPDRDLILAFSGDEETDMLSSQAIAERLSARKPAFAVNSDSGGGRADAAGKPLALSVQVAEKTFANIEVTVRNPGGHSARPRPDNAIYELADLLGRLRGNRFPIVIDEVTLGMLRDSAAQPNAKPELRAAVAALAANPKDPAALDYLTREQQLGSAFRTTCVPTLLSGGHADNALPQRATVNINCRIFPGVPIEQVRSELAAVGGNPEAEFRIAGTPLEAPPSPANPELFAALADAVADRAPGVPIMMVMTPGATDGKHFRARGIPTYGTGGDFTRRGEDSNAHGLNERIPVARFFESLDFWPRLMRRLSGGAVAAS
ncbi:M20/M25/M40 family metallo-hydrolase [Sphingomonas swuensis]|uniref:M20/M25/M40 family metallo-hydrolase n=1 Tax=Sphingomonas swuensis TaxID=977800 RepID=A0ABP7STU6_9SPHN